MNFKSIILASAFVTISSAAFACEGPLCTGQTPAGADGAFGPAVKSTINFGGFTNARVTRTREVTRADGTTSFVSVAHQVSTGVGPYGKSTIVGTVRSITNCPPSNASKSAGGNYGKRR